MISGRCGRRLLTLLGVLSRSITPAQNLVPNPGFEVMVQCPTYYSQFYNAAQWLNPTGGSPDYFNACATGTVGVPVNLMGYQAAHGGDAYAGIYLTQLLPWDVREYIAVELLQPLVGGTCYRFSMRVDLADLCAYTTDAIGMHVSDTIVTDSACCPTLNVEPNVVNTSGVLFDDASWREVTGTFTAAGGERFLTIGNFSIDADMLVAPSDGGAVGTIYCYIDDVSLAPCEGQGLAPIPDAAHLLMTDPSGAGLLIGASVPPGARLRVLDGRGRLVQEGRALPHHVIDLSARADGFYVVEIIAPGGLIARTKFIKQGR